jgi:hypothetical protein
MTAPKLIGRDTEIRVLEELITQGRLRGQAIVVIGEPGRCRSAPPGSAQSRSSRAAHQPAISDGCSARLT